MVAPSCIGLLRSCAPCSCTCVTFAPRGVPALQGVVELTDRLSIQKAIAMRVRMLAWGWAVATAAAVSPPPFSLPLSLARRAASGLALLPPPPPPLPLLLLVVSTAPAPCHRRPRLLLQLPYEAPMEKGKSTLGKLLSSKEKAAG